MIFKFLKHFIPSENWGNKSKMNPTLLVLLDNMREALGYPIHINCGYAEDGHSTVSQHYLGNAVDFVIKGIDPLTAYEAIQVFLVSKGIADEVGLGFYPDWHTPGFHIDIRGTRARWSKVKEKYVSLHIGLEYYKNKL